MSCPEKDDDTQEKEAAEYFRDLERFFVYGLPMPDEDNSTDKEEIG